MKRAFWLAAASAGIPLLLAAQQSDVIIKLEGGARPAIAAPDLRGSGAAQPLMNAFNETLYNDLDASGIFKMVPKTMYPLQVPQQPSDFREQPAPQPTRPGQQPRNGGGAWLSDWCSTAGCSTWGRPRFRKPRSSASVTSALRTRPELRKRPTNSRPIL